MKTLRLTIDPARLDSAPAIKALNRAAAILRAGGLVAFPTETVYGLGGNALDSATVQRIFAAKHRPAWDPVIVHIAPSTGADARPDAMLATLVREVPETARRLMAAFWPGPLTLLLPRRADVPDAVTAGRTLVGVRMPSHPVALELIRRTGLPVAAPSANIFGHTSPTTAEHVLHDLDGRVEAVLDAGPAAHGVESTVLDPGQTPMVIYRPGAVTAEQIRETAGEVVIAAGGASADTPAQPLLSPGLSPRHYAPKARLLLLESRFEELAARIAEACSSLANERIGIMRPAGLKVPEENVEIFAWGCWDAPEELAHNLYAGLRALDERGCTVILCPLPPQEGIGAAVADRLRKAAHPLRG